MKTNYPKMLAVGIVAFVAAFASIAKANEADVGVAGVMFFDGKCGGGVPAETLDLAKVYYQSRGFYVKAELEKIVTGIESVGGDYDAALAMWCSLVRPKLLTILKR